jgi:hypothetical protein
MTVTVLQPFGIEVLMLDSRTLEYAITSNISSVFLEGSGSDTFGKEAYLHKLGEELYWLSHQEEMDLGLYFCEELKQLREHISIETSLEPSAVRAYTNERIDDLEWLEGEYVDDEEESEPAYKARRRVALDMWLNT